MSGEASAAFWAWVEALREEHLKFSGFIPKEITALDAWRACWAQKDAELAALRAERDSLAHHEEHTHATLGAILGTHDSLELLARQLRERAEKAEAERDALRAAGEAALRTLDNVHVFVTSRERIHKPSGEEWFEGCVKALRTVLGDK